MALALIADPTSALYNFIHIYVYCGPSDTLASVPGSSCVPSRYSSAMLNTVDTKSTAIVPIMSSVCEEKSSFSHAAPVQVRVRPASLVLLQAQRKHILPPWRVSRASPRPLHRDVAAKSASREAWQALAAPGEAEARVALLAWKAANMSLSGWAP